MFALFCTPESKSLWSWAKCTPQSIFSGQPLSFFFLLQYSLSNNVEHIKIFSAHQERSKWDSYLAIPSFATEMKGKEIVQKFQSLCKPNQESKLSLSKITVQNLVSLNLFCHWKSKCWKNIGSQFSSSFWATNMAQPLFKNKFNQR